MSRVRPFLLFQDAQAEEAMNFYVSLIPGSEITELMRYPEGTPTAGTVMKAAFTVAGQSVLCTDSIGKHAFTFTPSVSFFLECDSEEEIVRLTGALAEGGMVMMPLDNYGFSRKFAFVADRFGVSWQLNLE
jgi:predicted 3-demethylubiquinone-9 3-methyltransferase (glyoxalase superfamily)